ncbi:MAG: glycosyltransferase [Oscillospiraceae bacterium]|nr:glycosyltransferase [Oscillospiraceae bacterium]
MKARVIEIVPEITLSVGMIVKNEEKNLPATLDALKPLLDSVKSELIITDTGSSDSTVEIAKRYTDKILHFNWVGDFAAARNVGLKAATGEWFMFLDADEVFDSDISEMTTFFNNRELSKKYNSATFQRKDYTDADKKTWTTFAAYRIARRHSGLRFVGKIHENLSPFSEPMYTFGTFAEHTGYTYETEEQREAKRIRNLKPIEEMAKKFPNDLRTLIYLYIGLPPGEKEACLYKILKIARAKKDDYAEPAFLEAVRYYYSEGNLSKTLEYADEYLHLFENRKTSVLLDIYAIKSAALSNLGENEQAIIGYEKYLEYYNMYAAGGLSKANERKIALIFSDKAHCDLIKTRVAELKSQI